MARSITTDELVKHKDSSLKDIDAYISSLISSSDPKIRAKADKLSYWLTDWAKYLSFEAQFSPKSLRRYKRGEIIKAHLGYNVGSEEGGLHYCVVVEKDNPQNSPVITIVPLTSVKDKTDIEHLHKGSVYLGNELFTNLNSKILQADKNIKRAASHSDDSVYKREQQLLQQMQREVQKMKIGSIALVSQIRTISKIRIYDPKTNYGILSGVKLSNEKLDLIDLELIRNFTNSK